MFKKPAIDTIKSFYREKVQKYLSQHPVIFIIISFWLLYGRNIKFGFLRDDFNLVSLTFKQALAYNLDYYLFRPLLYLSFPIFGVISHSAIYNHLINLLLFTASIFLAYKMIKSFNFDYLSSTIVVFIWVFIPWNSFSITWIAMRHYIIVSIFIFASLYFINKERYLNSILSQFTAILFNINNVLVGFYLAFRMWKKRKLQYLTILLAGLASYGAVSIWAIVTSSTQASGRAWELGGPILAILTYVWHFFEVIFLQIFPIPFFLGYWHVLLYLLFLVSFYFSISFRWDNFSPELFSLFVATALIGAKTPALRLHGISTIFMIMLLTRITEVKLKSIFTLSLALLLLFNITAIVGIQGNFNTGVQSLSGSIEQGQGNWEAGGYANKYYQIREDLLVNLLHEIRSTLPIL